ncbi:serine protein kinase RIO [Myxococcota bacterium]|nr:serine protein kinase RIO [Myxococcota bacterium]
MKVPKRLQPMVDDGLVDEVVSQLMGGKEASVYVVRVGHEFLCAKVYKEADQRSFKHAAQYQEGRGGRNSRRNRAIEKGSKYGRAEQEEAWQTAEVDALYRLANAGVRVPEPVACVHGVLLMELITDHEGYAAPRLNDVTFSRKQALEDHSFLMHNVMRMLCAGLVHGDLSEFNVLLDAKGPVIIDLPQAVDAAANNQSRTMLVRDINNITNYYARFAPELRSTRYAQEIWGLYEKGELQAETILTGKWKSAKKVANVKGVLREIHDAKKEEEHRQARNNPETHGTTTPVKRSRGGNRRHRR